MRAAREHLGSRVARYEQEEIFIGSPNGFQKGEQPCWGF